MQKTTLLSFLASASLAITGLTTLPANAQNNQSDITGSNIFNNTVTQDNQSDITGTNVFNNTVPGFFKGNRLSSKTIGQAEQLSQKLAEANRVCHERRECAEFNSLLEESRNFLGTVNQQLDLVKDYQVKRAW